MVNKMVSLCVLIKCLIKFLNTSPEAELIEKL